MRAFFEELRLAVRVLVKSRGTALLAILSLAVGIGANTAIYSVAKTVLFADLPYAEPDRLVRLWETFTYSGGVGEGSVSVPNLEDWRNGSASFEDLGGYVRRSANLSGGDEPVRVSAAAITGNLFPILGVEPEIGRYFDATDLARGDDRIVVLSHGLWKSMATDGSEIVDGTIRIDGAPYTVIGVMPPSFAFPPRSTTQLWRPLKLSDHDRSARSRHWLNVIGRLTPDAELAGARTELETVAQRLEAAFPESQEGRGVKVEPLLESVVGGVRPALLLLWASIALILLISCGNVANLLLIRTAARDQEFAVRAALGAGRRRLVRQILVEALPLAIASGVLGLVFSRFVVAIIVALPGGIAGRAGAVSIDAGVVAFCLIVSVAAALLSGIVPALGASRVDLRQGLNEAGKGQGQWSRRGPARSALIVAEVALAQIVLIGAVLMVRSFLELQRVDLGLRPDQVVTLRLPLPEARYGEAGQVAGFFERLIERVEAQPGVTDAGVINVLPIQSWGDNGSISLFGREAASRAEQPFAEFRAVSPDYFRALGIPLVEGRFLGNEDRGDGPRVALVNKTMARRYWPDGSPIGERVALGVPAPVDPEAWFTVVGVVGDVKSAGLDAQTRPELYMPFSQFGGRHMSLVIRSNLPSASVVESVRQEVAALDPYLPIFRVKTMHQVVRDFLSDWRSKTVLFGFFAAVALVLTVAGVYGVLAYSVGQKTAEIGLRMALGARQVDIFLLVLRQGLVLSGLGVAIGTVLAVVMGRWLSGQLFGVEPTDVPTLAAAVALLIAVTILACLVPAWRASALAPSRALRVS